MKKKFIIIAIALLLIINLSALATIGYHRFIYCKVDGSLCKFSGDDYLYQELSLSRSQIEQMKAHKQSFQAQADTISQQLFFKRIELVNLLKTSEPDSDRIHQALQEIGSLQTELQQQVIGSVLKQKKILNPEQQEKFFAIISDRLIHEARCKQVSALNSLENNCNPNYKQPKN
jgi:Spy/CpxP family protein refolding chaperone